MTQHDTWVLLRQNNPLLEIIDLFPQGQIPMRDPFPMELVSDDKGEAALFTIDLERLSAFQAMEITNAYAKKIGVSADEILEDAIRNKGFGLNCLYVEQIFCGAEGYQRSKELADFYERCPEPTLEQIEDFMIDQQKRWVDGDETPPPLPQEYESVDFRLRTEDLENFLQKQDIDRRLIGCSVIDVLTGRAMFNAFSKQNSELSYEFVGLEDLLEDE